MKIGAKFFIGKNQYEVVSEEDACTYRVKSLVTGREYLMDGHELESYFPRGNPRRRLRKNACKNAPKHFKDRPGFGWVAAIKGKGVDIYQASIGEALQDWKYGKYDRVIGPFHAKTDLEAALKKYFTDISSNPYPMEHAARLHAPGRYKTFRRQKNKFGKGIDAIWGIKK